MNNIHNNDIHENSSKSVDLNELLTVIWKGKSIVISTTLLFAISAVIFSLFLPNIYKSSALLSPVGEESGVDNSMKSLGGIASLAGIDLQSKGSSTNATKALDKIKSLSFFEENILPNIFLPDLMALKSWNARTNTINYDSDKFDKESDAWVRDFSFPQTQIPSAQESHAVFLDKHLDFYEDDETSFVTISVKHQSPYIAKIWTELIVDQLNYVFRIKDRATATAAVNYLNSQLSQSNYAEVQMSIAQLLQKKHQQLTLIEVNDFYVFDYIDPPAVMEKKDSPLRAIICILSAALGVIIGSIIVLLKNDPLRAGSE